MFLRSSRCTHSVLLQTTLPIRPIYGASRGLLNACLCVHVLVAHANTLCMLQNHRVMGEAARLQQ